MLKGGIRVLLCTYIENGISMVPLMTGITIFFFFFF